MIDGLMLVQQNVKVDVARSFVYEFLSFHRILNILQRVQESQRLQRRLYLMTRVRRIPVVLRKVKIASRI